VIAERPEERLVPEVTHAGEDHRHTWPVGSRDHQRRRVNFR